MKKEEIQPRLAQIEELFCEYKALLEQCEAGYNETPEAFGEDVYVRTKIDVLVAYLDLDKEPAFAAAMQQLTALDDRFKATLMPDKYLPNTDEHWWNGRVLKYAGDDYRETMLDEYGIEVGEA